MDISTMEEAVVSSLGYEQAFLAVTQAIGTQELGQVYEFIIRCYDLDDNGDC